MAASAIRARLSNATATAIPSSVTHVAHDCQLSAAAAAAATAATAAASGPHDAHDATGFPSLHVYPSSSSSSPSSSHSVACAVAAHAFDACKYAAHVGSFARQAGVCPVIKSACAHVAAVVVCLSSGGNSSHALLPRRESISSLVDMFDILTRPILAPMVLCSRRGIPSKGAEEAEKETRSGRDE